MPFPKSETVRGYTAGILDGEGSIMIVKFKNPTTKRGYTYQLKVVVTNTNRKRGKPQTDEESILDEAERILMRKLNSKGVH